MHAELSSSFCPNKFTKIMNFVWLEIFVILVIGCWEGSTFWLDVNVNANSKRVILELAPHTGGHGNTKWAEPRSLGPHWNIQTSMSSHRRKHEYLEQGLTMTVLNQFTSKITYKKVFPLQVFWVQWLSLVWHVKNIPCGRIVILAFKGRGSNGLRYAVPYLTSLGSVLVYQLSIQANWIWAFIKGGQTLLEVSSVSAIPPLDVAFPIPFNYSSLEISDDKYNLLRKRICDTNEFMSDLCEENGFQTFNFAPSIDIKYKNLKNVPVIVTAGSRVNYFYYTIKTLLKTPGIQPENVVVILGDSKDSYIDLLGILRLRYKVIHLYGEGNAMLFQYYRRVYEFVQENFSESPAAIFLDEDVEVSPDFFSYMNQTINLLHEDPSIYCINSVASTRGNKFGDITKVLRADAQVAWGYAVTLNFIREALSVWPTTLSYSVMFDYYLMYYVAQKRDCVFPEKSRSLHFGIQGENTDSGFSDEYFIFGIKIVPSFGIEISNVKSMPLLEWKRYLTFEISNSEVLTGNPCQSDFLPKNKTGLFTFYFVMDKDHDMLSNFKLCGYCLGFWGDSEQGMHDSVTTIRPRQNFILHLVGVPASKYSYLKPKEIEPWNYNNLNQKEKENIMKLARNVTITSEFNKVLNDYKIKELNLYSNLFN